MKKSLVPVALLGFLSLGACASMDEYGLGSSAYGRDPYYGGYGGSAYGMGGPSFQEAAVESCAVQAQRHGRVSVGSVQQVSSSTLRVYGTIDLYNRYERRPFACSFRSDGRITDFDID